MTFHKLAEQPPRTASCTAGCTAHPLHHALRILAPWIVHSLDQLIVLQEPAQIPAPSECRLDCSFSNYYCMFVHVNHLKKGDSPRTALGERADHKPKERRKLSPPFESRKKFGGVRKFGKNICNMSYQILSTSLATIGPFLAVSASIFARNIYFSAFFRNL